MISGCKQGEHLIPRARHTGERAKTTSRTASGPRAKNQADGFESRSKWWWFQGPLSRLIHELGMNPKELDGL